MEIDRLSNDAFRHRDHLRFAHARLLRDGYPFALDSVAEEIARFARRHGNAEKFHLTMTHCWVRLVAHALSIAPRDGTFEELIAARPELLDKALPLRYYSRDRLYSDAARTRWLEPDLRELPAVAIHRGAAA
jgi:hypothetical protein